MKNPAAGSDHQIKTVSKTKYLHVEIPEELFKQAKIQALKSEMKWTDYICSVLKSATTHQPLQNQESTER